jgi:hypothetical protein
MGNSKDLPRSHHMGDFDSSSNCDVVFFLVFLSHESMLSAPTTATKNCLLVPNFVKICSETITSRNFEEHQNLKF